MSEPAYTPRKEYLCDGSTTHYQGCKCHEERRNAELDSLQSQLLASRAEAARLREALEFEHAALGALLENDEIECRGDEDCDHCVALTAQEKVTEALHPSPDALVSAIRDAVRAMQEAIHRCNEDDKITVPISFFELLHAPLERLKKEMGMG